ncbi:MAG TPA: winged helix-turn-helix domain-containing protein [Blastocatellia bacterium]|nr:winged helix-turn-helix domain-containing protein [Blastocatellia bacterium]
MPFPETSRLELPILQELKATGGGDQLRYLYDRLPRYFPQLTSHDLDDRAESGRSRWARAVQRAGRQLAEKGELRRERDQWKITAKGLKRVEAEAMTLDAPAAAVELKEKTLTHKEAQAMLVEIGLMLGKHAEAEFEHYDVVWRDAASSPRLSHVFEVQISGSVDSALTRLKHAYDAQRSRPFLVVAGERDRRFAGKRLTGSFHEIWDIITVIGVGELQRLYEALKAQNDLLKKLAGRS